MPVSNNENFFSSQDSCFPKKDHNRERIILNPNRKQLENINLPNGIEQLDKREIEKNLGKIIKISEIKDDISVSLNQAANSDLLALKINKDFVEKLEIIVPSIKESSSLSRVLIILEERSKLDLLQVFVGNMNSAQNHLIEIILEPEAELNHGLISMGEGSDSSSICTVAVDQSERSKYTVVPICSLAVGYVLLSENLILI